jgi:hypothetical protein
MKYPNLSVMDDLHWTFNLLSLHHLLIFVTLINAPELTFSKEHKIGARRFDALLRAKVTLPLNIT